MATTATWAEFVRRLGWNCTSQRRGLLLVHGARPLLVKVTPGTSDRQFEAATVESDAIAAERGWTGDVLVVGSHPVPAVRSWLRCDPPAGLLGEYMPSGWHEPPLARDGDRPMPEWTTAHRDWGAALWLRCEVCERLAIYHETRSWAARPCGHDRGPWLTRDVTVPALGRAWAEASYAVARRRSTRQEGAQQ